MNFLVNCMMGIALGAGAILPGISSGVLCVIFGIYEKLLDSVLYFFSDIKKNSKFLFPLIIGGVLGIVLFGNLLKYLFFAFPLHIKSIFIGLILGSVPSLLKEINSKTKFKISYLVYLVLSLMLGIFMVVLENYFPVSSSTNTLSFPYLFLCGILMSVGVVVPGVSSTIILMLLGIYSVYLSSVSSLVLPVLFPMGLGLIVGGLIFMKFTKFLLERFYAPTFYSIIGFTIGSIFVLFPEVGFNLDGLICLLCIFFGFTIFSLFKKD